jgi:WD40 repeat protein/serine/threonine protein kinase
MSDQAADSSANYVLLTRLADEFAARYRAGERPSLQEYINRYPQLAADIREVFPALAEVEQVKEDHQEAVGQEAAPPALALQQLGDFRILREVGKGGMGIVYEAEQVSLGRHVALKVLPKNLLLDARAKRRFEREAKSAAKLHHTNIVPVFGVGEQDGMPYYVMQFIQGLGLDEVLEELKKLQLANTRTGTYAGGELRVSRKELSAVHVARSLLTGEFMGTNDENGEDEAAASPEAAPKEGQGADSPRPPALSDSFTLSSSSVVLPGRSRDGSKSRHRKQTYWQSVASIGVQVANALEYAHKQGIKHRDVKPSNLLLDTRGTVWVTDFGLAKVDDQANLTHTGDIVGTLRYMPPEAFEGKTDVRSDVYSLGLTLYEMLAFRPAFEEKQRNRLIKQVTQEEPARLGKLNRHVPPDLEIIVHKAIDKDPNQRYASAGAFAEDLQRFIEDEPIKARRVSQTERLWRWCRRNPAVAALTALVALLLLASAIGTGVWAVSAENTARRERETSEQLDLAAEFAKQEAERATREAYRATREAEQSRRLLYASDMLVAQQVWEAGDTARTRAMLDRHRPQTGQTDLRGFEWFYLWGRCQDASKQTLRGHTSDVLGLNLSHDGRTLGTFGADLSSCIWDLDSQQHKTLAGMRGRAVSPDGKTLAFGDGKLLQLWSLDERRVVASFPLSDWLACAAFSPDGGKLAAGCYGIVHLFDVQTRQELKLERVVVPPSPVFAVAFSPDGRTLASGWADTEIRLWDLATGKLRAPLRGHTSSVRGLSFTSDGKTLASTSYDASIRLWDTAGGKLLHVLRGTRAASDVIVFSPDDQRLAAGGVDGTIRIWDLATRAISAVLRGHAGLITGVTFTPDGRTLISSSLDATVKLWDAVPRPDPNLVMHDQVLGPAVAFSNDGKILAMATVRDNTVRLWNTESHQWLDSPLKGHEFFISNVSFSRDGRFLGSTCFDKTLRLWNVATRRQVAEFPHGSQHVVSCDFSPDGKLVASSTYLSGTETLVWDIATRQKVKQLPATLARFSPDGTLLATSADDKLLLWDVATWEKPKTFTGFSSTITGLAFAPDGKTLAACEMNGTIRLWDMVERREIAHRLGHTLLVQRVAFSPDGRRLATGGVDSTIKLWDLPLLQEVATLTGHDGPVTSVAFSPDGLTLASASADATIRLWRAPPAEPAEPPTEAPRPFLLQRLGKTQATAIIEGKLNEVQVTAVDDTDWHVQFYQLFGDLEEGATYAIRFRAKADVPRSIGLNADRNGNPNWDPVLLVKSFSVTDNWEPYEVQFTAKDIGPVNRIFFILGQQTGTVWIDDFTVTKLAK